MARTISVYHTTALGKGDKIIRDGWLIADEIQRGQIYGRGIYFWEKIEDAHTFGKRYYGINQYEILEEDIPYRNVLNYNMDQRTPNNNDADTFARRMISKGYEMVQLRKAYMDDTTILRAVGNAYVWLVDTRIPFQEI